MNRDRSEILIQKFINTFTEFGLDGSTTKKLAKSANITESLIYVYFENKEDIIKQCTIYYHEKTEKELLQIVVENLNDFHNMKNMILEYLEDYMNISRFLLQVMAHPKYHAIMVNTAEQIEFQINNCAKPLSTTYDIDIDTAKSITLLINSVINNYVLKQDKEYFSLQFDTIAKFIKKG